MAETDDYPRSGRLVAAIFHDMARFRAAVDALVGAQVDPARISILGPHEAVQDHFAGRVPEASELADRPDTPRESLDDQTAVHRALRIVGETAAAIGLMGATAAAYAVGGPVGVAIGVGADTEASVEGTLERFVDQGNLARYKQSLADGGLVLWVQVFSAEEQGRAAELLTGAGGEGVHAVET